MLEGLKLWLAGVQTEICGSCGAAVATASLLWPDPDLQGLCSMYCGTPL